MNERSKLEEARYFLDQMVKTRGDRDAFVHNLNAFLSSSRSVLQYARKEANDKEGGQAWYDDKMSSSDVLSFFKDKRDLTIHEAPVQPGRHISVHARECVRVSDSVSVTVRDPDGNVIAEESSAPPSTERVSGSQEAGDSSVDVNERFVFKDWDGDEDVLALCNSYLSELEAIVEEGIQRGVTTG